MGFFSSQSVNCSLCKKEGSIGGLSGNCFKIADGYLCDNCRKKLGYTSLSDFANFNKLTTHEISTLNSEKELKIKLENLFTPTKSIKCPWVSKSNNAVPKDKSFFEVDETNKLLNIPEYSGTFTTQVNNIYRFEDIIDCELLEDGLTVATGSKLTGAIVGGVLLGGLGAIAGALIATPKSKPKCSMMSIKITTKDIKVPAKYIVFINMETHHKDSNYKKLFTLAQESLSILTIILKENQSASTSLPNDSSPSVADEILKFKQLLDMGAITQEEFNAKKSQLLNSGI